MAWFQPLFARFACLTLLLSAPFAHAFEWRKGEKIVVEKSDVVMDDLYATGEHIIIDGEIDGDLVAFGERVTINGLVKGNLIAAGESIEILGEVTGNAKVAGAGIKIGKGARLGQDLVGAGAGFILEKGAHIDRDFVFAGASVLLEGNVHRNVLVAAAGLDLRGEVHGSVTAKVGEAESGETIRIFSRKNEIPTVKVGINVDKDARIYGPLEYSQDKELTFPKEALLSGAKRLDRLLDIKIESPLGSGLTSFLRSLITLFLLGLLLLLIMPRFIVGLSRRAGERPLAALLWGLVLNIIFVASLVLIAITTAILGIALGLISFGVLLPIVIIGGVLLFLSTIVFYLFAVFVLAKIVVAHMVGRLILSAFGSDTAENRYVAFLVGLPIIVGLVYLLSLSFVPSVIGWLVSFCVSLLGLGALWLSWRERGKKNSQTQDGAVSKDNSAAN